MYRVQTEVVWFPFLPGDGLWASQRHGDNVLVVVCSGRKVLELFPHILLEVGLPCWLCSKHKRPRQNLLLLFKIKEAPELWANVLQVTSGGQGLCVWVLYVFLQVKV